MGVSASRLIALESLTEVRRSGAYIAFALSRVLERKRYATSDIGYGSRLAHLSVATYRTTSRILANYLPDPQGLPKRVHDALAVSVTELVYLDAPDHVVDQGVELVKHVDRRFAGLANAVLRQVASARSEIRSTSLGYAYGFDDWLARQLVDEYGTQTAREIMRVSNEQAPIFATPLSVAPDDWREQLESAGAIITDCAEHVITIEGMHAIREHPLIVSRAIPIIDPSALQAIKLAPIGGRMLEVGCGRGTKSLIWADRARRSTAGRNLSKVGEVLSPQIVGIDIAPQKIDQARRVATGLGYHEIAYRVEDATRDNGSVAESFDSIFVDAPCSGLGTLRRHSDKRLTLKPDDIESLAELALEMLRSASRKAAKGASLVYATCTISRRENDEVVTRFLDSPDGAGFSVDRIQRSELPAPLAESVGENGWIQMIPLSGGGDGHFIARMKRD